MEIVWFERLLTATLVLGVLSSWLLREQLLSMVQQRSFTKLKLWFVRNPQHSGYSGNKFEPSLAAVGSLVERRAAFGHYALKADRQDTTTLRTFGKADGSSESCRL